MRNDSNVAIVENRIGFDYKDLPKEEFVAPTDEKPIRIILGDVRNEIKRFPENTFQSVITSPPYWGLRDYGFNGQIGAEKILNDYIVDLVNVFREVRRVLKPEGSLWLNIGNTYTSGGRKWRQEDKKNKGRAMSYRPDTPEGLKKKDLIGVAWMIALALQMDGWYLRNDIIWFKPNGQPESVKDRVTVTHEYLFLLTKSEKYYFNQEAIKVVSSDGKKMRNKRSVWAINTEPCPEAHFAVFPRELVRPCILAGSKKNDLILDPFFGSGTVGIVCLETGRRGVGIELKPDYITIAKKRLKSAQLRLFS